MTVKELLRRGGLTTLLFVAPDGYAPYGGRSSQFHFQEAIISSLCEIEAKRYKQSDPAIAGAFKRQAHLSALCIRRWINEMSPIRHIKNSYPPETSHGIDRYGQYSVYSLLCSSFLGVAVLMADDEIAEAVTPAEIGGYVLELSPAFHKVFANAAGTYIEVDTASDTHYDATGLGRILFKQAPLEMILSMPFSGKPAYRFAPGESSTTCTALGCSWSVNENTVLLAESSEGTKSSVNILSATPKKVKFAVSYELPDKSTAKKTYTLSAKRLDYSCTAKINSKAADRITLRLPVIITDGESLSKVNLKDNSITVKYRESSWTAEWNKCAKAAWEKESQSNRNARYKILKLTLPQDTISISLRLDR